MSAESMQCSRPSLNSAESQGLLLSQLISVGKQHEVAEQSRVHLPDEDIESYSGYITVDSKFNSNLFFWLFPATKIQPQQAPLIVYLNGGPGFSSFIGLFEEIGPIKVNQRGQVSSRKVTWTDLYSVVFIDNPVGVGFSYCDPAGEAETNDKIADQLLSFLCQFLKMYPQFQECDMYIGGMSFAGKYIPALGHRIIQEPSGIKLQGIFIGGGLCNPGLMLPFLPEYLVSLGMLSAHEGSEVRLAIQQAIDKHRSSGKHTEAIENVTGIIFGKTKNRIGYKELDNLMKTEDYQWHFESYLNLPDVQKALHVKSQQYKFFNEQTIMKMAGNFFDGVSRELAELMNTVKVLMFSGQMDMVVNIPMTEALMEDLPWSGQTEYSQATKKQWISTDGNLAGYVTKVRNFTRVVIRNAGHRCAIDQPTWTFDMINRFISDESFI